MPDIAQIAEELGKLTVLEAAELVKKLEEEWGVSAAAPAAVAAAGPAAGPAAAAEEQTEFKVILASAGANKIAVIKEIRALVPGLGLADAKAKADTAPQELLSEVTKEVAEDAKKRLEAAGATVEVK